MHGQSGSSPVTRSRPGFERVTRDYFAAAYALNYRLNDLLFSSLGIEANERARLGSVPFCVLKQLRYGPGRDTLKGSIGAGAHADWGSLTILSTDGTPGLQVELDGRWLPVPPKEGMLIVNAGDQIDAFTNGFYRSAKHRVITTSPRPRYSTAFFTYFNYKEKLAPLPRHVTPAHPLRWPPMDTHEWFQYKLRQSVGENVSRPVAFSAEANATTAHECDAEGQHAIRRIDGAPLGVEALGFDLLTSSDAQVDDLIASMHAEGRGLLVVRNQTLSPEGYEAALFRAHAGFGRNYCYEVAVEVVPGSHRKGCCAARRSPVVFSLAAHRYVRRGSPAFFESALRRDTRS